MKSSDIKALQNTPLASVENLGPRLMTTNRYPFLYQRITKCGSTFLRNLLWYLDHGEARPPEEMNPQEKTAKDYTSQDVRNCEYKFVVVRNPVNRFMSLYFDKILGKRDGKPIRLATPFLRFGDIDQNAGEDIDRHRRNCDTALDFIANQQKNRPHQQINWHWKAQMVRMSHLRDYGFDTLHLEGLDWQLPRILGDLIPDLDQAIAALSDVNRSPKPVQAADILTDAMAQRIQNIYQMDTKIWTEVRDFWDTQK